MSETVAHTVDGTDRHSDRSQRSANVRFGVARTCLVSTVPQNTTHFHAPIACAIELIPAIRFEFISRSVVRSSSHVECDVL